MLEVGGFQPFSTTDWPGKLCAVVFVQGCPWRCSYCHNPGLQPRERSSGAPDWAAVRRLLERRRGLLDGVVFSGGEPTIDPFLPAAIDQARALGHAVGLHTAGIYVNRLSQLLARVDWVGFDLKTSAAGYDELTGARGSASTAAGALAAVTRSGVAYEVRTTLDPQLLAPARLREMARELRGAGVTRWVLQRRRWMAPDGAAPLATAPAPDEPLLRELAAAGLEVELR